MRPCPSKQNNKIKDLFKIQKSSRLLKSEEHFQGFQEPLTFITLTFITLTFLRQKIKWRLPTNLKYCVDDLKIEYLLNIRFVSKLFQSCFIIISNLFQNYFKVVSIIKPMTETAHYVVAIFWQKFWSSKCQISLKYSGKWFVKFWVVASYLVGQLFNDIFDRKFINFVFARNVFEKQSLWLPTVQKVEKIEKYFFFLLESKQIWLAL